MIIYKRFAGAPVGTVGGNDWTFQPTIEPTEHLVDRLIREHTVDCASEDDLLEEVKIRMNDPFSKGERSKFPWWEFLILRNKNRTMSSSAVIFRCHHAIGDGLSLVSVLKDFVTLKDGSNPESLLPPQFNGSGTKISLFQKLYKNSIIALRFLPSLFKVLSLPVSKFDDDIAFNSHKQNGYVYSKNRNLIAFDPISLDFLKKLKSSAGVTINDLLMAALSQSIHDYNKAMSCTIQDKKKSKVKCRALVPISMPRDGLDDHQTALRNQWCLVSVDIGVGIDNIMERLNLYIHSTMNSLK